MSDPEFKEMKASLKEAADAQAAVAGEYVTARRAGGTKENLYSIVKVRIESIEAEISTLGDVHAMDSAAAEQALHKNINELHLKHKTKLDRRVYEHNVRTNAMLDEADRLTAMLADIKKIMGEEICITQRS